MQGRYLFKLLAVDVPSAAGPEQRIYLEGDQRTYNRGAVLREMRDPLLNVSPQAQPPAEALPAQSGLMSVAHIIMMTYLAGVHMTCDHTRWQASGRTLPC